MAHGNTWQYEIDFINGVSVGHKNPMHLTPAASQPKPSTSNPRIHAGCKGVVSNKNNDQDVILYWTCTNFYTMIWSKITNKHQQIWFAYHLNYFDRIIYVLICIWFACLRIEDMTPACPEAVSLQDPGASALFRPNSSQTKNQNPKKKNRLLHHASCTSCTGLWPRSRSAVPSGRFVFLISNLRLLRHLRPSKKTKDAAVVRFVPPASWEAEDRMANTANTSCFLATGLQFSHAIIQPWWFSSTCIASMFAHFKTTKIDTREGYYRMTWLDMTKTMDTASDAKW